MDVTQVRRGWQLLRCFGPKWLIYRAFHAARMKTGLIRVQLPVTRWDEQPLGSFLADSSLADPERYADYRRDSAPPFFFSADSIAAFQPLFSQWDTPATSPTKEADEIEKGFLRFFSHEPVAVGNPPQWHVDPFTQHAFPSDRHWSQIADFAAGDIKLVWEANRFGFVFTLVRSYWRTGDQRYAELFWKYVESWFQANSPELGVNWKCGQEISLRVMAWCFGLYGFASSSATTPVRVAMLAQMIAVSGRRIEVNIGYALSQQNNHGISEAMGLWTIGALFPEFTDAARWAAKGRRLLESQARDLIASDGTFSQHSMNYHRVMLHLYLWSIRLGDLLGRPFSDRLRDRIACAGEFIYQVQDEATGRVPCYGQDDGAFVLPLNNCGYRDYRALVQASHFLTSGRHRLESGPWNEDLLWFFGPSAIPSDPALPSDGIRSEFPLNSQLPSESWSEPDERIDGVSEQSIRNSNFDAIGGGYFTLRSPQGFAMIRASSFKHRPAQADMLHVDIWWQGENIAIDPGTYSYNSPPPWNNRFAHTAHHNTVTVDGQDQMERAGRFLWLPWINGKSFGRNVPTHGDVSCWNGEHDGYQRLSDPVTHRRGVVRLGANHWLVVDSLSGREPHSYCLNWLFLDAPYELDLTKQSLELATPVGRYRLAVAASTGVLPLNLVRASADSAYGWRSSFYHDREPAISVRAEVTGQDAVFATVLGPDSQAPIFEQDGIYVGGLDWNATVALNLSQKHGVRLVASVEATGSLVDPTPSFDSQSQLSHSEPLICTSC